MKLIATGPFDAERARALVPSLDVVQVSSTRDLLPHVVDAEVVIGATYQVFPDLIRAGRKLRWVHTSTAGVDLLLCPEFLSSELILTCAKDGPAGPNLAEHGFGLLLALTRNIGISARQTRWARDRLGQGVWELGGKTLGVVGYGGVGREMAARGRSWGMSVIAVKRRVSSHEETDAGITIWPAERLPELLNRADAVMLALPGTPETIGLLNATAFRAMKPSAYLVNVGRGASVVTEDLVAALKSGEIAGAGLDVTDPEPLPDGHPLWSMEQVVITPHIAGAAPERAVRNAELVMENLLRFAKGEPLKSVVDRQLGY